MKHLKTLTEQITPSAVINVTVQLSKVICTGFIKAPVLALTAFSVFVDQFFLQKDPEPSELTQVNPGWYAIPLLIALAYAPLAFTKYLQAHLKSKDSEKINNQLLIRSVQYSALIFVLTDTALNIRSFDKGMRGLITDDTFKLVALWFGHSVFSSHMVLQSTLFGLEICEEYCAIMPAPAAKIKTALSYYLYGKYATPMWIAAFGRSLASSLCIWGVKPKPGMWIGSLSTEAKIFCSVFTMIGIVPKRDNYILSARPQTFNSPLPKPVAVTGALISSAGYNLGDGLLTAGGAESLNLPNEFINFCLAGSCGFGFFAYTAKTLLVLRDQELQQNDETGVEEKLIPTVQ